MLRSPPASIFAGYTSRFHYHSSSLWRSSTISHAASSNRSSTTYSMAEGEASASARPNEYGDVSHLSPHQHQVPSHPSVLYDNLQVPRRNQCKEAGRNPAHSGTNEREQGSPPRFRSAVVKEPSRSIADLPHAFESFSGVVPAPIFHRTYSFLEPNETMEKVEVRVGGRLCGIRNMGAILFLSIRSGGSLLQVIRQVTNNFSRSDLKAFVASLKVGDIVGAVGSPGRTKKGELSLYASSIRVLVPYQCADQAVCPSLTGFAPLVNQEIRYRYRFVDMMTNPSTIDCFKKRHAVLKALRQFLDAQGYTEVETPMLLEVPSGANAKPFGTHHDSSNRTLYLRIAPELYMKQCVVGGMERIYEIGRVFRNEESDRTHNPEFTSCELYSAFNTYRDLMPVTEDLLRRLAMAANGTTVVKVVSRQTGEKKTLDLATPFRRVSAYDAIQAAVDVELPPPQALDTPLGMAYLSTLLLRYGVPFPSVRTASKMFDKLIEFFITDRIDEPVFVMDHPLCMSPLAKEHPHRPGLSERFELYINGVELCNAYSELNDPQEQFRRFQNQLMSRHAGDDEAMEIDETFLKALHVGLPPTAGWGMGIDRLMALLTEQPSIRDAILGPLLRMDENSRDGKRKRKTAGLFSFSPAAFSFVLRSLEQEMRKRGMSTEGCEQVRALQQKMLELHTPKCFSASTSCTKRPTLPEDTGKWLSDMSLILLELCCGRKNR